MKRLAILLFCAIPGILSAQAITGNPGDEDIFLGYIMKMSGIDCFAYDAVYRQKQLFETDTSVWNGHVVIKKDQDSVFFIHIKDEISKDELLYKDDSAWSLVAGKAQWDYVGKGLDSIEGTKLMNFVPLTLYTIQYSGGQYARYWQIRDGSGPYKEVDIAISEKPKDITGLSVRVIVNSRDSMAYGFIRDATFGNYGDDLYQETRMSNYIFPGNDFDPVTASFRQYPKKLLRDSPPGISIDVDDEAGQIPLLAGLQLETPDGSPFSFPDSGIVFLDLWYAGCYPCLKSAPVIEKLYDEYKGKMAFYSVNEIDKDISKIERYMEKLAITFPVLLNHGEKIAYRVAGSNSYPVFLMVDGASGKVLWYFAGYTESLENILRKAMEENL
jgi:thiol-disulfide isomerase/thioredoxin